MLLDYTVINSYKYTCVIYIYIYILNEYILIDCKSQRLRRPKLSRSHRRGRTLVPWDVADSWLVTGDVLPSKNPNEIIHGPFIVDLSIKNCDFPLYPNDNPWLLTSYITNSMAHPFTKHIKWLMTCPHALWQWLTMHIMHFAWASPLEEIPEFVRLVPTDRALPRQTAFLFRATCDAQQHFAKDPRPTTGIRKMVNICVSLTLCSRYTSWPDPMDGSKLKNLQLWPFTSYKYI